MNFKKIDTGLTKVSDICHDCAQEKGLLDILSSRTWKKWDSKQFKYVTPE